MYPLNSTTSKNKKVSFLLLLILIMGFLLRIYHLGSTSLWYDEINTIGRITYPFSQIIKGFSTFPFPPLYYTVLHLWVKIFGISEFSLRFPSLVFSVLSIIMIFKLAKELFSQKVGLIAALLLSVSLYSIDYAREAKMYAMLWFFGLVSFYFFYKFTKDHKIRDLILYIVSTTITVYTLYVGFLFIVIQNVTFCLFFFNPKQLKKWLAAQMILILLYLPWVGIFIHTAVNVTGTGEIFRRIAWIPKEINYLQFFFDLLADTTNIPSGARPGGLIQTCLITAYVFLFISAFVLPNKKREKPSTHPRRNEYILLAWVFIPIISLYLIHSFIFPILIIRYIGFIHIPLIILFSKGLNRYSAKIKYSLLILLLYLTFSYQLYPYYKSNMKVYISPQEDWRKLFRRINAEKSDNALITMFANEFTKGTYLYFIKGIKYYNHNQQIQELTREEMERCICDKKYDSIFLVYYYSIRMPEIDGGIEGYRLEKEAKENAIGYFWFKKL